MIYVIKNIAFRAGVMYFISGINLQYDFIYFSDDLVYFSQLCTNYSGSFWAFLACQLRALC
jgi:hypothetical protein